MSVILSIQNLAKAYGPVRALKGVSFNVPEGSVYGVLGPNGSGKTTLLAILLDVLQADSGTFQWFGGMDHAAARKQIGSLLETPNFYHYLSAVRNLEINARIKERGRDDIDRVLDIVKLTPRKHSKFSTYSLGMKQRLAIANALLGKPKILLLDEPTNGLDPEGIAEIRELIRELNRQMLAKFLPLSEVNAKRIVGIYSANYKLAIFITLFIQAFKMAAEPFFFNQAKEKNAPGLYARVMKWFVITLALAFLFSALYLDVWKYLVGSSYRSGLGVVPVLLFANICLGIYYNLSVWYKLTDQMRMGLYITLAGAIITLVGNYVFIPKWGMYASAWSTLVCYASMVVLAYFIGQKYYPVPYPVKKILSYLTVMLIFFFIKIGVNGLTAGWSEWPQLAIRLVTATVLMLLYLLLILKVERSELRTMPFIGMYLK